ncbi:ribosome maturation factor RimM [Geobacter pickeringii]|uniref:Ribosome maturation factor RimM n=1 Tax=Geobacter pickeringii TaxID=345632 RepID=A0A0B5BJC6_9BACT|nr:ribosome maturation factor RimM [Geobacter pickeringii]AJE04176.1 ribosome maturation factor RimM [Geobacter pickeringii]
MLHGKELLLLGKIVGTHGIRGQLKVVPFSGEHETILSLKTVMLKGMDGRMDEFEVAAASPHRNVVLLTLKPYTDINEVLRLVGRELYARRDQFPALAEGEYYWCDLVGLAVRCEDGTDLGRVAEIISTGGNDVYVVRGAGREYLIPAVEEIVTAIDLAAGTLTVSPPEGLFDL